MSCTSLKKRLEALKSQGSLDFNAAMVLYNDVNGSVDAHRIELQQLRNEGNQQEISKLEDHIKDGERMINELKDMNLH